MVALRMLGYVVLAAFVVMLGVLGYEYARSMHNWNVAKAAAVKVEVACGLAIASGDNETVRISIPSGYTMRFAGKWIIIDGFSTPDGGLAMSFADGLPELGAGDHELLIRIENNRLVVERWT